MTPALELIGIGKRFGSVVAVDDVSVAVDPGEIHVILGENGAGKSTLLHVAVGLVRPDRGSIRRDGHAVAIAAPPDARKLGIGMVHQHFTSVPAFSVRDNLRLAAGDVRSPAAAPPPPAATDPSATLRRKLWRAIDPAVTVGELPVEARQRIEMLKALATGATVLLLDEPTAVLAPPEAEDLLQLLEEFTAAGGSALLITHKLPDALRVAGRITVLRAGRVTLTGAAASLSSDAIVRAMVGPGVEPTGRAGARSRAETLGPVVARAGDLVVHGGEIVGIAAVEGNGQRELLRSIAGVDSRPADHSVTTKVAFVPEDRTTEGLIPSFSLSDNLILGNPDDPRWARGFWLDRRPAIRRTGELIEGFGIRAPGPNVPARSLSGGNQQKLVLARALDGDPALLVAESPSRGLDFRASAFVAERLRRAAEAGVGVLVYSSDLDELLAIADRLVVMYRGRVIPVPSGATRDDIGAMMAGSGS